MKIVKVTSGDNVHLPISQVKQLKIKEGEDLISKINKNGEIVLSKIK